MKIEMKFEGGAEIAAAFAEYSRRWQTKTMTAALVAAGEPMRAAAARYAPRGEPSGPTLAEMIILPLRRFGTHMAGVAIGPKKEAYYGFFQEYGTVHHAAHPFMRPAFDSQQAATLAILSQVLWMELAAKGTIRTGEAASGLGGGLI
jgi:HK97 gp10 family phage protein